MRQLEVRYGPLWLSILFIALILSPCWADLQGKITDVKWDSAGRRILIPHKGALGKHQTQIIGHPNRLVVDFEGTELGGVPRKTRVHDADVYEIRVGKYKGRARIVVDFQQKVVPPFRIVRKKGTVSVLLGKQGSNRARVRGKERVAAKSSTQSPLSPKAVPASGHSSGARMSVVSRRQARDLRPASSRFPAPLTTRRGTSRTAGVRGAKRPMNIKEVKLAQRLDLKAPALDIPKARYRSVKEPGLSAPGASRAAKRVRTAQRLDRRAPALHSSQGSPGARGVASDVKPSRSAGIPARLGRGRKMVREVRPPVTPPTPDPRLVVQEITELKFIQVGHNSRLVVRGGDHLDYRMTKVSPTKVRLDLINAEIPKVHQKPLKTDEFSTSVEMIVPGSQTIFIQLKDAVPYQVQKKKGVLMIDFPPPRFALTTDQQASLSPAKQAEKSAQESYKQKQATLLARREAARIMREEEFRRQSETISAQIASLLKEQEEILKERRAIERKYRITADPEVFSKPVTMDFQGISVRNVFRLLGEQAGLNIIVGDDVRGTVTMRLRDVPLGQVIDHILKTHNLERDLVGNVMWIGRAARIRAAKRARMAEYRKLIREANRKLKQNKDDIRRLEKDREKALEKITKAEEPGTELPTEAPIFETIGETETIDIDGEPVTLLLVRVKLNYAEVNEIAPILRCVFNRRCAGQAPTPAQAQTETLQRAEQRLAREGFLPGSPGGQARLDRIRREIDRERRTQAAEQVAAQTTARQAQAGLRGGEEGVLDSRMQRILAHTLIWENEAYNMLFIKDLPDRIEEMKRLIQTLDVPTPQVLIEARIVRASRDWSRGMGINWGVNSNQITSRGAPADLSRTRTMWGFTGVGAFGRNPASGIVSPYATALTNQMWMDLPATGALVGAALQFGLLQGQLATDLDVRLNVGESNNKVKIVARPKVQVLDRKEATILDGRQIPYPTVSADGTQIQLVSANIQLSVTPQIYPDGRIQMDIQVMDNQPGAPFNGYTSIENRSARTVLIVKDGETAVIGGLLQNRKTRSKQGWPGLMNVPLVNFFFGTNSQEDIGAELLVFITPSIIKKPPAAS